MLKHISYRVFLFYNIYFIACINFYFRIMVFIFNNIYLIAWYKFLLFYHSIYIFTIYI